MRRFMGLTRRNLLIYFKDKQAIFFSLLTSIIVFVLYLLFLRGSFVEAIESATEAVGSLIEKEDIHTFSNGMLLCGIVGSAMITIPFNCLGTVIRDRELRIDYDISVTPMGRWQIVLSYFTAASISAFLLSSVIMTIGIFILGAMGNLYLTPLSILSLYGLNALGSISSTALFMLVVLLFKSSSASGAFFGILSAVSGFIIGAYIPLTNFNLGVQTVCNIFPATGLVVLYRNALLNGVLEHMDTCIGGVDNGAVVDGLKTAFSFQSVWGEHTAALWQTILFIGIWIVVCVIAMILMYRKVYKRK